jgi:hypothetical protein
MKQLVNEECKKFHPEITCKVCGADLYLTDRGNHMMIYHCSSSGARFWDFERGIPEQEKAKKHWDNSMFVLFPQEVRTVK